MIGKSQGRILALFSGFDKEQNELTNTLARYIESGDNPSALMNIGPNEARQLDSCMHLWQPAGRSLGALVKKPGGFTVDQWARLGQVLALADTMVQRSTDWPQAVPAWFMSLQVARAYAGDEVAAWDIDFVQKVLTAGGVTPQDIPRMTVAAFFSQIAVGRWWYVLNHEAQHEHGQTCPQCEKTAGKPAAMGAFVLANIDQVPPALSALAAPVRVDALKWLQLFPNLMPPLAPSLSGWAVGTSKTVREAAVALIAGLDEPLRSRTLSDALDLGTAANLGTVIDQLAVMDAAGREIMQAGLGSGGKKEELLQAALQRSQTVAATPEVTLEVPPAPPVDNTPLGEDFTDKLEGMLDKWRAQTEATFKAHPNWTYKDQLKRAAKLDRAYCEALRAWVNGTGPQVSRIDEWPFQVLQSLSLPLAAAARFSVEKSGNSATLNFWRLRMVGGRDYDLRTLAEAVKQAGVTDPVEKVSEAMFSWYGLEGRRDDDVWPFFAEHPERLDQALGLIARSNETRSYVGDDVGVALHVLRMFPSLPARYAPALAKFAAGTGKTYRRTAQEMLAGQPNVVALAVQTLGDGSGDVRAAGAAWLARLGDKSAVDPLRAALAKEKQEAPQAAMLNALSVLGDDISAHLTPAVLLAAAKKGLAAKPPTGMDWFPLDGLPSISWTDGTPVDTDILRWWCVLAVKLKNPLGAGLIPLYVGLLDGPSRETLGKFVLDAWIAQDTRTVPDEECRTFAAARTDRRYDELQLWFKRMPESEDAARHAALTKDQIFEDFRRKKATEYAGSAISEKGLLALTVGAPGHYVFAAVQRYIRDHGQRRAQVEALITTTSGNPDPSAVQLVLSVARKFKQESVRLRAVELAEGIAERTGWSMDELADRTIPTAGFDESGVLVLDYGARQFTGRIARSPKTGAFTINVFNPDGKPITALPKPGASDTEEVANESRKQLTTSKKELTQVAGLQTSRLFEAMCTERTWDGASWREYLLGHPVVVHLISTLVWQVRGGALFRPTVDGELLDGNDEPVVLADDARVGLAHAATVTPDEADAWRKNLADFDVTPLFNQFDAVTPQVDGDATKIDDHKGWLSDSFAIRGRATKRGFARGQAEDGGSFYEYVKNLPGVGIKVIVGFTGSWVPEEQLTAAVTELTFEKNGRPMPIGDVPKILLAESYADYVYVAEAGAFDKDWETKSDL